MLSLCCSIAASVSSASARAEAYFSQQPRRPQSDGRRDVRHRVVFHDSHAAQGDGAAHRLDKENTVAEVDRKGPRQGPHQAGYGRHPPGQGLGEHRAGQHHEEQEKAQAPRQKMPEVQLGPVQDGQDVRRIKERYARTRASLQAKGTKGARRVLKRISGRENRMMSDVNHRISKTLVSGCRAGVLHVFEDLSGVSFQNLEDRNTSGRYELRSWTFYSLEMKTAYKAAMRRGAILKVDPRYTSQKCPGCGTIDKTARNHSQHRYTCKHCGRVYNDDEVAAKNLHQLGIWYISGVDNPHFSKKVSGY